jgi:uncharacterized protein (DUF2141 family)
MLLALTMTGESEAPSPNLGDITVVITNLRNGDGEVLISRADAVTADNSGQVTTVFEDLPHGDYAIACLHDEDRSQGMTFGKLHLPKEGYCFSNNVKVRFRPPKFKKAKFTLEGDNVTQTLRMRY